MRQDRHLHFCCKFVHTLHFGSVDRDIDTAQFSKASRSGNPGFPQYIGSVRSRDIHARKQEKSAEIFANGTVSDIELFRCTGEKYGHLFSGTFEVEEIGFRSRTTVKMHV